MRCIDRNPWATFVALALIVGPVLAQTEPQPATPKEETAAVAETPALPAKAADPGFAIYADLLLVNRAWRAMDADLMADVALQLAHGEKILQRSHRGASAKEVFDLAAQLALENKKIKVLDRLLAGAKALGREDLEKNISAQKKLAGASRGEPAPAVALDDLSGEELALLKAWTQKIKAIKLLGDPDIIKQVEKQLPKVQDLSDKNRQSLQTMVAEMAKDLREGTPEKSAAAKLLGKLSGTSRPGEYKLVAPVYYSNALRASVIVRSFVRFGNQRFYGAVLASNPDFGSPLRDIGLRQGDIITRLDGIPVQDYQELENHYAETTVRYLRGVNGPIYNGTIYIQTNSGGGGDSGGGFDEP